MRTGARVFATSAAACLGAVLVVLLSVSPVRAAAGPAAPVPTDPIGLSRDGRAWTATLPTPLFDSSVRWVPGDVRTESFYLRNQAAQAGALTIGVTARDPDDLMARADIVLSARRDGGPWIALPSDGRTRSLGGGVLGADARSRIEVRATLVPDSPNRSQTSRLDLSLVVHLRQAAAIQPPVSGPGGQLPNTGGVPLALVIVALLALAAGALLLLLLRLTSRKDPS